MLEAVGFAAVWCWDHFMARGGRAVPALECWTTLTGAALRTSRVRVGSFVTNVVNRHPAVLAATTATLQATSGGRVDVGIGAGGHPAEHAALGIDFPAIGERIERLDEAVTILRALWSGQAADVRGRHYSVSTPLRLGGHTPPPRIVVAGAGPRTSRLAGRIGDAWTTTVSGFESHHARWREAVERSGRDVARVGVVVELPLDRRTDPNRQPLLADLGELAHAWRERGATEIILGNVRPEHVPALLAAAERAGLRA